MLSMLHNLLSQVLAPPDLHTAVLLTTAGELVSFASQPSRAKDQVRIIAGLCTEVWQETREYGCGMVDSEVRSPRMKGIHDAYTADLLYVVLARENHRAASRRVLDGNTASILR